MSEKRNVSVCRGHELANALYVLVTREESGRLATNVYRKPTATERILAPESNHPIGHKISFTRTLWDRVEAHCNSETAKHKERKHLYNVFQLNGYPRNVVRQYVKRRSANPTTADTSQDDRPSLRSIPYIKGVSEGTARILSRYGIQVGHKPCGTLQQLLMQPKDPLPHSLRSDVVYRVGCKGCSPYYVGETRKTLQSRIREHQGAVQRKETTSLIWMHTAETGHSFDFENAKAIDHGRCKGKRLVKEALHSGIQAVNRCVSLSVQYQAIQVRTNHKEVRQIQVGDRPGARTDPPADETPTQGPSFTGPITHTRARMMAEAGQTRDNPSPS